MSQRSEIFGRLLKGALNSIAAYEGKTAPAVEADLGAQIGLSGSTFQRYKAGSLPPDVRTVEAIAVAAVRRGYLGRAWLQIFLQAARYPNPDILIARLVGEPAFIVPERATLPTGTVTFLFTDVVGSTRLWETQAGAMQRALARHDAILRQAIRDHGGYVFKTVGDTFCVAFATAPVAVEAALAIQYLTLAEPWFASGLSAPLQIRMALHTGAAEERDGDYFGAPLNRAARMCGVGHGGQILLSLATQELARDHLPPSVNLRDLGEQRMKDLARPERLFQLVVPDLPSDFPPLHTLNTYRHNLPAQLTVLIGREREVDDITELLRDPEVRLLTLTGSGGIGKTRLALQVASELVEQFADGAWFVDLAAISNPTLIAGTIASILSLREQGDRPIGEVLRDYVRTRALLLVLDNFEQVLPAGGLVADLMTAAPQLKILITSRVVLRLYGEREYVVPSLSLPKRTPPPTLERVTQYEAVRLFIERSQAVRADFTVTVANAPQIAEICHRLDGLPLAIELAAARSKLFGPQAILSRLDKRLVMLTGGAQNLPARQQTLRGAIDWSYNLLDAAEQESFARLGIFVGGFTLEAATAVLTAGDELLVEPLDILSSLVDKSLLRQAEGMDSEPRFFMLETIREYALERLAAHEDQSAIINRYIHYYLDLAERTDLFGAQLAARLDQYEVEYGNFRQSLSTACTSRHPELALRLGGVLARFWELRGKVSEGRIWLTEILRLSENETGPHRARALWAAGSLAHAQGDYAESIRFQEEGVVFWKQQGNLPEVAKALHGLALAVVGTGDYTHAAVLQEESLALARQLKLTYGVAAGLVNLGTIRYAQDNLSQAQALIEEGLEIARVINDAYGMARTLRHLGNVIFAKGDPTRARTLHLEGLALSRQIDDVGGQAGHLINLALIELSEQVVSQAAQYCEEGLALAYKTGDRPALAHALAALVHIAELTNQHTSSCRLAGMTAALIRELNIILGSTEFIRPQHYLDRWQDRPNDTACLQCWLDGHRLTLDQAMSEAQKISAILV